MRVWLVVLAVLFAGCSAQVSEAEPEPAIPCEACLPACGYPDGCDRPEGFPATEPAASEQPTTSAPASSAATSTNGAAHSPVPRIRAEDPRAMGPLEWQRQDYDFGILLVDDPDTPGYQYPVQVTGSVHSPTAGGPGPLLVLMHGRHGTCAVAGVEIIFTHVCPNAGIVSPVNSYAGYDYMGENLASHGYVVVSINANQINDRDLLGDAGAQARAELTLHTIEQFHSINASGAAATDQGDDVSHLQGRIDMGRIGLMGHSRGGQGVVKGAILNEAREAPFAIQAIMAIAPTDFDRYAVPDIPFATILPYCDGDVSNLQGAWMFDNSVPSNSPRTQFVALGANHNWFNTVWTGSDYGGDDAHCASDARYAFFDQLRMGLATTASFFRAYVGGEPGFGHYVSGLHDLGIPDLLISHVPGDDDVRWIHQNTIGVEDNLLGGDNSLGPALRAEHCMRDGCLGSPDIGDGGFWQWTWGDATIEELVWQATFPAQDLRNFDLVCLRFAVIDGIPENAQGQPIRFVLLSEDATGTVRLEARATQAPPGDDAAKTIGSNVCAKLWEFDVPLDAVIGTSVGFEKSTGAVKTDEWFFAKLPRP